MDNLFKNNKFSEIKIGKWVVILSPFFVLSIYKLCSVLNIKTLCIWKLLTGHNCWGCGMTHATICILKGNFIEAIEYNKFVIIVFPLLLFCWLKYIFKTFKFIINKNN